MFIGTRNLLLFRVLPLVIIVEGSVHQKKLPEPGYISQDSFNSGGCNTSPEVSAGAIAIGSATCCS